MGIISMPFGPIGMFAGSVFGAVTGFAFGLCVDRRNERRKLQDSELAKKRLESLIRWALARAHDPDETARIMEAVILEFNPIADIASGSKNARDLLKHFDRWMSERVVVTQLWVYMDERMQDWRNQNRADFLKSMRVFQTLRTIYSLSSRSLSDQEQQLVDSINRLLAYDSVKSIMDHAQLFPTPGELSVMESIVVADIADDAAEASDHCSPMRCVRSPSNLTEVLASALGNSDENDVSDEDSVSRHTEDLPINHIVYHSEVRVEHERNKAPVLKKPFFRNWDDFMNFDQAIKHHMPITLSEFDLVLEKSEESNVGWEVCCEREEIKISKQQLGSGVIMLRAWAVVQGVDVHVAFNSFYVMQQRMKWDKVFSQMELIGDGVQGSDCLYSSMKITGVTPRDFLQYRRVRVLDDGAIVIVQRSAEHELCPESKGIIRAESYISGYVLRQKFDQNGISSCHIFIMTCTDVKGLIPKWIISYMAPRAPAQWIDSLKNHALDYMRTHPNYKEEMAGAIGRFKTANPFDYEQAEHDESVSDL